jgi:hypothetical protein
VLLICIALRAITFSGLRLSACPEGTPLESA